MNLILQAFFVMNLIFIVAFAIGRLFVFEQKEKPLLRAGYALFLGVLLVFYFISILSVVIFSLFHQKYFAVCLLPFILIPFLIGQKATYEKLGFYSNLQMCMFFVSLLVSYFLIKF